MSQLRHIEEAQRVVNIAWSAGYFETCLPLTPTISGGKGVVRPEDLPDAESWVRDAALALLADGYPDVTIRVRAPRWGATSAPWVKVVAAVRT